MFLRNMKMAPYVIFRDKKEIALHGISALSFNQILQYLYTGSITIREENVFDIFESMHFLQIKSNGDPLLNRCVKWMVERLGSSQKLNASLLVKVCNKRGDWNKRGEHFHYIK